MLNKTRGLQWTAPVVLAVAAMPWRSGHAQIAAASPQTAPAAPTLEQKVTNLTEEVAELKALVHQLQDELAASKTTAVQPHPPAPNAEASVSTANAGASVPAQNGATSAPSAATAANASVISLPQGITINALLDGYYEYNLNAPVGRVDQLRAYDVSSNGFSLNQADLVIERAPDPAAGQRLGLRLDLQFGQATSTLQGNPVNELRPDIYRNIFQAYGSYVLPVAAGLTVDFGKFASSLGLEGNYTKDQKNYSRSLWFDYLPFYHMGVRAKLAIDDEWAVNAWIVNGTDQTEAFNNYKDQLLGIVYTPNSSLAWTLNLYQGQEHPDVVYLTSAPTAAANLPDQQGTYISPIAHPPTGKLEIADSYITWQITKALFLAAEADFVQERLYPYSPPQHVDGGALYAGLQLSPRFAIAGRAEYLEDPGGLFSGASQYLKEETLTLDFRPGDGFLVRGELRRDQSDRHYFYSKSVGVLESSAPTIGVGLVWWLGQKSGAW